MRGYSAQPMSSRSAWSSDPASTALWVDDQTNGQFTMNDPRSPWNLVSDAGSSSLGSPGPPTPEVPMPPMISAAALPASVSRPSFTSSAGASGLSMMWPPAPSTSALIHTVSDSALAPWTARSLSWSWAACMICSHVTGCDMSSPAASATDLRYQRSCVFAQNGMATSSSFHVEASIAPCTTSCVVACATSSGTGARKSASANSAMNTGSRLMMSIDESFAARRRASCSRCDAASRGSSSVVMRYAPPAASVQAAAMSAWPPLSGLMYHVSSGVPSSPGPHAASGATSPAATRTASARVRRRTSAPLGRASPSTGGVTLHGYRPPARPAMRTGTRSTPRPAR
ncbi:Uncharacterised protein [Mycobacteroides abscessus]|nr:Uncharacterised protein [Mycobacteroides abscessus]